MDEELFWEMTWGATDPEGVWDLVHEGVIDVDDHGEKSVMVVFKNNTTGLFMGTVYTNHPNYGSHVDVEDDMVVLDQCYEQATVEYHFGSGVDA